MAMRKKIRRRVVRARATVRRVPSSSATAARKDAKESSSTVGGLMIGGVHDPAEKAADQMADRVMRMSANAPVIHRKCAACDAEDKEVKRAPQESAEEEEVQTKPAPNSTPVAAGSSASPASAGASSAIHSMGSGKPLPHTDRNFFESRFGANLSSVRIHHGESADKASRSINARAFAHGNNIAFARGERQPWTDKGRHLMAHELAHVVVGDNYLHRKEDVCPEADAAMYRSRFITEVTEAHAKDDDNRVVREIKKLLRCDTTADDAYVSGIMMDSYGAKKTKELIEASKTALGGHVGFYPKYARDIKSRLGELGVSDTEGHKSFATSASGKKHRKRAAKMAKDAEAKLARADILYFRGHQFARFRAPGMFTDGKEERGVDLRYLQRAGGFPNVKLMISTSCATLCNEAISVFTSLFPKATLFGYGNSAPILGGQVRREFGKQVRALKSPLLLESASDVSKLTSAWKATIEKRHPKEKDAKRIRPGIYNGSKLFYWSGKSWVDGENGKPTNKCGRKRDFRGQFPAPPSP